MNQEFEESQNTDYEGWTPSLACVCGMPDLNGEHDITDCIPGRGHPWYLLTSDESDSAPETSDEETPWERNSQDNNTYCEVMPTRVNPYLTEVIVEEVNKYVRNNQKEKKLEGDQQVLEGDLAGAQPNEAPSTSGDSGTPAGMPEESRTEPRQDGASPGRKHQLYIMEQDSGPAIRPKDLEAISEQWRCTIVATTILAIVASFVWLLVYKFV